ncbi:Mrx4p NDAI_0K01250 [Naumovozyma dairenensis CBS 421]|uniref:Uncharacterized protein n=1 Tax=Naumovozyma dairenensis (strain ATCC 10597 / BCRC 20456 / CBS 421 / NBRC 0211 / NRRL Y-12639) TaxID=1071378 RepID=G0WHQ5_NAUDC|nr:hypothetical protein NDAI_0K01250 [Naumovozyma dairenensis CBS 421]CCD27316.1 hypothetical protein NDAI_0K01250 [Naumovozyma dairenensis CBS 421]
MKNILLSNTVYNRIVLLKFSSRTYTVKSKGHQDWSPVFDPTKSKNAALKLFRKNIIIASTSKWIPVANSKEAILLASLGSTFEKEYVVSKDSLKKLYNRILTNKINDDYIYQLIKDTHPNKVTNIKIPNVNSKSQTSLANPAKESINFKPQRHAHVEKILKQLLNYDISKKDMIEVLNALLINISPSENTELSAGEIDGGKAVNIVDLERYLKKLINEDIQKKKLKELQWKTYNWGQVVESPIFKPGSTLFEQYRLSNNILLRIVDKVINARNYLYNNKARNNNIAKEYLIFDLKDKSRHKPSNILKNSMFTICYRDLFAVINSSEKPPEETLTFINEITKEDWTLVGNLYEDHNKLIFERPMKQKNSTVNRKKVLWVTSGLLVTSTLFVLYRSCPLATQENNADKKET